MDVWGGTRGRCWLGTATGPQDMLWAEKFVSRPYNVGIDSTDETKQMLVMSEMRKYKYTYYKPQHELKCIPEDQWREWQEKKTARDATLRWLSNAQQWSEKRANEGKNLNLHCVQDSKDAASKAFIKDIDIQLSTLGWVTSAAEVSPISAAEVSQQLQLVTARREGHGQNSPVCATLTDKYEELERRANETVDPRKKEELRAVKDRELAKDGLNSATRGDLLHCDIQVPGVTAQEIASRCWKLEQEEACRVREEEARELAIQKDEIAETPDCAKFANLGTVDNAMAAQFTSFGHCLTENACREVALRHGLKLGGNGYKFAEKYSTKGLYAYKSGRYAGMAFFGEPDRTVLIGGCYNSDNEWVTNCAPGDTDPNAAAAAAYAAEYEAAGGITNHAAAHASAAAAANAAAAAARAGAGVVQGTLTTTAEWNKLNAG